MWSIEYETGLGVEKLVFDDNHRACTCCIDFLKEHRPFDLYSDFEWILSYDGKSFNYVMPELMPLYEFFKQNEKIL